MSAAAARIGESFPVSGGPIALRIAVGRQLRNLRIECAITREAAGDHIRGSHAKISRLELGRTGFKERDVEDLLTLYGVTDTARREMLLDLVRRANQPGWWHGYGDLLPPWFGTYLGLEGVARSIRTFEAHLVPGLLQTENYMRGVVELGNRSVESQRRVELRRKRQAILDLPNGPTLWAVLDEAVLERPIGGNLVLREQLEHLVEMSQRPNVTIQVLADASGGHPAAGSSFTMMRFGEPELTDIVYLEQLTSAQYLDRQQDLDFYRGVMDKLSVQAEAPDRSRTMLMNAAAAL